jgi:N-acetylmuramoyl-L-alanine amidase
MGISWGGLVVWRERNHINHASMPDGGCPFINPHLNRFCRAFARPHICSPQNKSLYLLSKKNNTVTLKQICLIVLCAFSLVSSQLQAAPPDEPFVLVLDAGHGGGDPGSVGKNAKEKDITLAVTLLTGQYIAEKYPDVKVLYTRKRDLSMGLKERADFANKSHANLFISIHTNSVDKSTPRGSEVFAFGVTRSAENLAIMKRENSVISLEDNYKEKYADFDPNSIESYIIFEFMQNKFVEQSLEFASTVLNELKACAPWNDRGVKQAAFLVLREAGMPRVLVELDFISNPAAEKLLMSDAGQKKYAAAICNAFGKYKADYDRKNDIKKGGKREDVKVQNEEVKAVETEKKDENEGGNTGRRVYKVQLLALPAPLPANSPHLKGYKASYYIENKMYKYTYGESESREEIARIRRSLLKDFKDAFVVAFEDGEKVPIN